MTPLVLSPIRSRPIAPLLRHQNLIPHLLYQHASITILYLIHRPITTLHCLFIPYPYLPLLYPTWLQPPL